jgi:dihydrofolate synthase/folylpolyglutamate synthase
VTAMRSPVEQSIEDLLASYGRFGVDLGLDRIVRLLQALGSPHQRVPIVHVAGTNGKGSVCAYLSSVLTQAGYRVGCYTSPHLVSWCERITLNQAPIPEDTLLATLQQVERAIASQSPSPTQFEVLTAAAWQYFAEVQVDIAVVEVGLGGRLDATNVVEKPLVTVITSLSREHWQRLGPTLADIAREKAGILKAGRPAVIGPLPPEAATVVKARLQELSCPAVWPPAAVPQGHGVAQYGSGPGAITYPLPFAGEHQLVNSALAMETLYGLRSQGWAITDAAIHQGMAQARWPGRLQWVTWLDAQQTPQPLLIDGAHNPAAAKMLRRYVDSQRQESAASIQSDSVPVVWLMGMLSTKDHREIFEALLRPGDALYLVPVPGHLSADPQALATLAQAVCPDLSTCSVCQDLRTGLATMAQQPFSLKVLCGSLYLIGHFFTTESFGVNDNEQRDTVNSAKDITPK